VIFSWRGAARVDGLDGNEALNDDVAGIHARVDVVDGDPGGRPFDDRPHIGVPAPVEWQVRGVEIDAAVGKEVDYCRLEDAGEEGRDTNVGTELTKASNNLGAAELVAGPQSVGGQVEGGDNLRTEAAIVGMGEHGADDHLSSVAKPRRDLPGPPIVEE
jgi:hypothetical protein